VLALSSKICRFLLDLFCQDNFLDFINQSIFKYFCDLFLHKCQSNYIVLNHFHLKPMQGSRVCPLCHACTLMHYQSEDSCAHEMVVSGPPPQYFKLCLSIELTMLVICFACCPISLNQYRLGILCWRHTKPHTTQI
jgi:hypothetical protein